MSLYTELHPRVLIYRRKFCKTILTDLIFFAFIDCIIECDVYADFSIPSIQFCIFSLVLVIILLILKCLTSFIIADYIGLTEIGSIITVLEIYPKVQVMSK